MITIPILEHAILVGTTPPNMPPRDVIRLEIEYEQVNYNNFVTNLCNLQKALASLRNTSNSDNLALINDRRLHPINMENPNMQYPRWDGSDALRLLTLDVDKGKHLRMPP
jgi:hypothetical protein